MLMAAPDEHQADDLPASVLQAEKRTTRCRYCRWFHAMHGNAYPGITAQQRVAGSAWL